MRSTVAKPQRDRRNVRVVAHRGASGYAPENTMAAFALAVQMGASAIELDVHLSRDREIVVLHDPQVDGTTNGTGAVGDLTLAQLRRLDAGSWFNRSHPKKARPEYVGEKIPTLQEAIHLVKGTAAGLYIEIKDPELYPDDFEARIVSLIRRNEIEERVVLLSFCVESIRKARDLDSSIRTALLTGSLKTDPVASANAAGADELAVRHTLLTAGLLRKARAERLGITAWTVNTQNEIKRALTLGVYCVISNYPDRVLKLLGVGHG